MHKLLEEFEIKDRVNQGPVNCTSQQPNLDIDFADTTNEVSYTPQIEDDVDELIQGD